ncbi:MAG: glutaredoxin family protein [Methylococcaceae bacterium]|nr:glutaredoxin family protein [Methylococcaceae bacterium]
MPKPALLLLIALLGGLYQNQNQIKNWLNPPPPAAPGSYNVVLYSTTWCGYCAKMRSYFADHHIRYRDVDVERSEEGIRAYADLGGNGVPIVVIGKQVIYGYAPEQVDEALALN